MKGKSKSSGSSAHIPNKSFKDAGANVVGSRLNKGGDQNWRGARGGAKMTRKYSKGG